MNMNSLALDPSLSETGYAVMSGDVVIEGGTLKSKSNKPEAFRLRSLAEGLRDIIQKHSPQDLAIEVPYVGKNPNTAIKLGGVRGVILELAETKGLSIYEYTTFEIKKAVTGNPIADKEQVNRMVETLTGVTTSNYNISDAIAVGLCHSANMRFRKAIAKANHNG